MKINNITETETQKNDSIIIENKIFPIESIKSKNIYEMLVKHNNTIPVALAKRCDEFPFLNDQDFKHFFLLPKQTVRDTKLQVFQFKIIHRILPCQENLRKWKLSEHGLCGNCASIETLEHLLFYCCKAHEFWYSIQRWISDILKVQIRLSVVDVLFGIPGRHESCSNLYINFIIMHAKYYLFKCKLDAADIFMLTFLKYLKYHINTDSYIDSMKHCDDENIWYRLLALM